MTRQEQAELIAALQTKTEPELRALLDKVKSDLATYYPSPYQGTAGAQELQHLAYLVQKTLTGRMHLEPWQTYYLQ